MTIWSDNAARFATDSDQVIGAYRNAGIRDALGWYRKGRPDFALSILYTSLEKQARLSGIRDVHLPRRWVA